MRKSNRKKKKRNTILMIGNNKKATKLISLLSCYIILGGYELLKLVVHPAMTLINYSVLYCTKLR